MFVAFCCLHCRRSISAQDGSQGKPVRCPACAAVLIGSVASASVRAPAPPLRMRSVLPWLLLLPGVLALGLSLWAGYGVGWAALGVTLGAGFLIVGQWGHWSLAARLGASLPLAILGNGLTLAGGPLEAGPLLLLAAAAKPGSHQTPAVSAIPALQPPPPSASRSVSKKTPEELLLAEANRRTIPDMQFVGCIGDLLALATPEESGSSVAFATTATGALRQFSYPDFRLQATHQLRQPAYRAVLDGRRGLLWVAASEPHVLSINGAGDRPAGRGDLHVYDIAAPSLARQPIDTPLQPRRILTLQGNVMELLATADRSRLFYLAQTEAGIHLGRIDAGRETVDGRLSLPAEIRALCLTPDGTTLYAAGEGMLLVIDAATLRMSQRIDVDADFCAVAADNEGHVYLGEQGTWTKLRKLDLSAPGTKIQKWAAHVYGRIYLRLSPDGYRLYVGTSSVISNHLDVLLVHGGPWSIPPQICTVASDAHGPIRGEFFLTSDARFLVNRWGKVFHLVQLAPTTDPIPSALASLSK
jgi:hypothetical protein